MAETKRLNKAISETGYGETVGLGVKVTQNDAIAVNGQIITKEVENIYLAFHKPIGITCTTDTKVRGNIINYLNYPERIFPIGRLDKPSEGLIFMTNDGDIVNKILRSKNNHEKEYIVSVDKKISETFIKKMGNGIPILGTITDPCKVEKINHNTFKIILTQGLNRQIRRMCSYLSYEVQSLKRTRIMNISLDNLKPGKYRSFTEKELRTIEQLVGTSSKTEEAS
jgi:23S rRNA pseudouridine2604 synthase